MNIARYAQVFKLSICMCMGLPGAAIMHLVAKLCYDQRKALSCHNVNINYSFLLPQPTPTGSCTILANLTACKCIFLGLPSNYLSCLFVNCTSQL